MISHPSDRWLWVIVGGGLLIAATAVPHYLRYIYQITEAPDDKKANKRESDRHDDAELSLKLETLEKLTAAPNYALRSAAIKIIADRAIKSEPRRLLMLELAGADPEKRDKALQALWFLLSHPALKSNSRIKTQLSSKSSTWIALVDCLVNILPLHKKANKSLVRADNPTAASPILPHNRPRAEITALKILDELLTRESVSRALAAGIVSRWLAAYPFPCTLPENQPQRLPVVAFFDSPTGWSSDDVPMVMVLIRIGLTPEGLAQLYRHGLAPNRRTIRLGPPVRSYTDGDDREDSAAPDGGETESVDMPHLHRADQALQQPRRRGGPAGQRTERAVRQERRERRERREAAVYSEGDAPITQENIFQRPASASM